MFYEHLYFRIYFLFFLSFLKKTFYELFQCMNTLKNTEIIRFIRKREDLFNLLENCVGFPKLLLN